MRMAKKWEVKSVEEGSKDTFLRLTDEYHIVAGKK
jgi:hypothetical protein